MKVADGIYTLPNLLSAEECDKYIAMSESAGFSPAPISTFAGEMMRPDIRNNARLLLDDERLASTLWRRIRPEVPAFLAGRQAVGLNERFRFYRYDPGQQFALHRDGSFARPNGDRSLLTFLVYLNDGFEGGETIFIGTTIEPKQGMALIFKHPLAHEGATVVKGRKYVLRSDVMYGAVGGISGG